MVSVTAFFAGVLGLMFIGLSALVIMARGEAQATLGHGDHEGLKRRIRAHGNFAEYVPFALLLMGLAELGGTAKLIVVFIGAALLIARIAHAYNILIAEARNPMDLLFRKMVRRDRAAHPMVRNAIITMMIANNFNRLSYDCHNWGVKALVKSR